MSAARQVRIGTQRISVDDDQPTFWDRVEGGNWEPGTLDVLERHLGPGRLFVDVGSWVGALTMYAASLGAEVIALEADPRALDQLRRNLAANTRLVDRVTVLDRALAPVSGLAALGARRKPGDSMSSVLLAGGGETWTTPAITPAELADHVGARPIDLLKIDIEGGEYGLLPTLDPLLARTSALLLALHPDILRASGQADPAVATRGALAVLDGWQMRRVAGQAVAAASLDEVAAAGPAEWLFRRRNAA